MSTVFRGPTAQRSRWLWAVSAFALVTVVAGLLTTRLVAGASNVPTGRVVPFTVVADEYVMVGTDRLAVSRDLSRIQASLEASGTCPGGCFSSASPLGGTLLVATRPNSTSCAAITGVDVRLVEPRRLRVTTTLHRCHVGPGEGSLTAPQAELLAIPLSALPSTGVLGVEAVTRGDSEHGAADESARFDLGVGSQR